MDMYELESFRPGRRHVRLAHLLQGETPGLARRILYQLLAEPQKKEEVSIAIGEDAAGLSVGRALRLLEEDGLVEELLPGQERGGLPAWRITSEGVRVVLAMQTIGPVHELARAFQAAMKDGVSSEGEPFGSDGGGFAVASLGDGSPGREQKRNVWHVTMNEDGRWKVKREGADRATSTFETKKEAVEAAKEIARKRDDGRVVKHLRTGAIQDVIRPQGA